MLKINKNKYKIFILDSIKFFIKNNFNESLAIRRGVKNSGQLNGMTKTAKKIGFRFQW